MCGYNVIVPRVDYVGSIARIAGAAEHRRERARGEAGSRWA